MLTKVTNTTTFKGHSPIDVHPLKLLRGTCQPLPSESPPVLTTKTATESNVLAWFPACCMQCVQVYSVNLCRHLRNHSRNARIIAQNMSHYFTQQKMQSKQNYVSSLGVFEVLCGVFPGVFEEPLLIRQPFSVRTELFIGFMGVFDDPELFDPEEL